MNWLSLSWKHFVFSWKPFPIWYSWIIILIKVKPRIRAESIISIAALSRCPPSLCRAVAPFSMLVPPLISSPLPPPSVAERVPVLSFLSVNVVVNCVYSLFYSNSLCSPVCLFPLALALGTLISNIFFKSCLFLTLFLLYCLNIGLSFCYLLPVISFIVILCNRECQVRVPSMSVLGGLPSTAKAFPE